VTVISPGGKVLRRWGKHGTGSGEFRFIAPDPTDPTAALGKITVSPDGLVYVSDSGNGRVQVFTPQGRFVRQFGSFGSGKGQFFQPSDLMVDKAGKVYVADDQAGTLSKFSPGGTVIWQIGGSASSDRDLSGHFHLASIDAHGRLVMVNDDQQRILYVDPGGHKIDAFSPNFPAERACGATVDAVGDTYVSGCGPGPHAGLRPGAPADREMAGHEVHPAHVARLRPERRGVRTRHGRVHPPAPHHASGGVTSC
jgi:DNA-binding beta-propeller fold protein YncE